MSAGGWTFLSNYGHVIVALSTNPDARMRDLADMVGITERAVQQIVRELVDQGYVFKEKDGRRNRYHIANHAHLRHELEAGVSLGEFVALVRGRGDRARLPRPVDSARGPTGRGSRRPVGSGTVQGDPP